MTQPVEYTFNASALGVGGYYVSDGATVHIPSTASVALAPSGGTGESIVRDYDEHGIKFSKARSAVTGRNEDGVYTTVSEIEIHDLDVLGRLKIKKLRAVVKSERHANAVPRGTDEAEFQVVAQYEGVTVDDCVVRADVDSSACRAAYPEHHAAILPQAALAAGEASASLERGDSLRRSVVTLLPAHSDSVKLDPERPYVLHVPRFGRIHFGELFVKRGRRRVNLLRLELEEAEAKPLPEQAAAFAAERAVPFKVDTGVLSFASPDGNGEPVWPRQ